VLRVLAAYPHSTLLAAAALAAAQPCGLQQLRPARPRMDRHRLPRRQVVAITFVSYAFNLNFGALVGGFASASACIRVSASTRRPSPGCSG
jgi:uncharacterized membrane protein YbhN (UPF0104 family)